MQPSKRQSKWITEHYVSETEEKLRGSLNRITGTEQWSDNYIFYYLKKKKKMKKQNKNQIREKIKLN